MHYLNRIKITNLKKLFCVLVFLTTGNALWSQRDTLKEEPYVYFNGTSYIAGFMINEFKEHDPPRLKQLVPQNSILQSNPDSAKNISNGSSTGIFRPNIGVNFHFKTRDWKLGSKRFSSEWRVGLNIGSTYREKSRYSVKGETPVDTFYSNHTNTVIYEGGAYDQHYQYIIKSKQVYVDISKTYHSNQLKRFSIYTGINVGISYSFSNSIEAVTAEYKEGQKKHPGQLKFYPGAVTEKTNLPSYFYYQATVPIGFILRVVSYKKQIAKRMALTGEVRLGYRFDDDFGQAYKPTFIGGLQLGCKMYLFKEPTNR
ncbi:MAG: hypothetical protein K0S53_3040 [Bacteroidetes bacterium]|jgi:hypothetical protein|nr:hypothetical protein [Bacteroidota bacterium]MDF2450756.1 hypothetical protein [Bacteroidota bacterium]